MSKWTDEFNQLKTELTGNITDETVKFAKKFGNYLGKDDTRDKVRDGMPVTGKNGRPIQETVNAKLTTNQLRKFFGEVKRQQMNGYSEADFVLLKPKLAYAVGRTKGASKIKDFYEVMSNAIDIVAKEQDEKKAALYFKNFIKIFEAIVAYHKAAEEGKISDNN